MHQAHAVPNKSAGKFYQKLKRSLHNDKTVIHQEDKIFQIYVPKNEASKHTK